MVKIKSRILSSPDWDSKQLTFRDILHDIITNKLKRSGYYKVIILSNNYSLSL